MESIFPKAQVALSLVHWDQKVENAKLYGDSSRRGEAFGRFESNHDQTFHYCLPLD
jgi:hypothetical protein